MSVEYSTIATRLAQNIANAWKLAGDEGLSSQGMQELIKASIKPTEALLKLAENYNTVDVVLMKDALKQVQTELEQEQNSRLSEVV